MRWPDLQSAALMQALGMDGVGYLLDGDAERSLIQVAVADKAQEILHEWRDELAALIINKLGKAMK